MSARSTRHDGPRRKSTVHGDVAIIGMACTYPGARNLGEFWTNIVNGVDCIGDVPPQRWDTSVFYEPNATTDDRIYCKRGGYIGNSFVFNPLQFGTMPRAVEGAEPDQFLVLRTVHEAMEDAGYIDRDIDGENATFFLGRGNYLGAGLANLLQRGLMTQQTLDIIKSLHPEYSREQLDELKAELRSGLSTFSAETAPGLIPNITTGRVANRFDFMGPTFTLDAACASSLIATELAVLDLLTHRSDLALAGGVHIFTDVPFLMVFTKLGALSRTEMIRPFDKNCDGTMPGEGVGILVMKRLADAQRDDDRIYAIIKGVGSSSDGKAMSVTAPRVEGEELAVRRAYEMSGVSPDTITLIEAHGTGTPIGDQTELEAMHRVFGGRGDGEPTIALGSIKSMIGHAMPAAGAAALIKTALAVYHRVLPPTLNCQSPHELLSNGSSPLYLNTETRPWIGGGSHPVRAGVSAFGFGGVNAHIVLEEPDRAEADRQPTLLRELDSEVCILSGDTREALLSETQRIREYAQRAVGVALRDIAYTLNRSAEGSTFRLAVVATSVDDLADKLVQAAERLSDAGCTKIKDRRGIYFFGPASQCEGKIAFLFPGEGSQYVNMLAGLCPHFPQVRACFDDADRAVQSSGRRPPSADIFPPPSFDDDALASAEKRLWQIERATEAVLTADGAMFTVLDSLGVKPDVIAGHSAGEWAAMVASGIFQLDEFLGSLPRLDEMYRQVAANTDIPKRVMLAVGADRETVARLAKDIHRTVHIANDNCPHQVVIVVEPKDADAVEEHLRREGVFVERLPYDRGYHTPSFTYICDPLRSYFSSLKLSSPTTTLYSCTTAQPFPSDPASILDLAANTFTRPLLFREMIEAMYADGARVFVEVGPRGNLTAFVDDILRGQPHLSMATNVQRRSDVTTLNHAIAMLAAWHVPIRFDELYRRRSPKVLTFDPAADAPVDEAAVPGVMNVALHYPVMALAQRTREISESDRAEGQHELVTQPAAIAPAAKIEAPVDEPPTQPNLQPTSLPNSAATAMRQHMEVMEQFLSGQEAVMRAYLGTSGTGVTRAGTPIEAAPGIDVASQYETAVTPVEPAESRIIESRPPQRDAPEPIDPITATESSPVAAVDAASTTTSSLTELLLGVVSDRTGYPLEMLDLDLDMEADLGIDSIKRVEILGSLQQLSDASDQVGEIDMEEVAKLKTLRQVIEFLEGCDPSNPSTEARGDSTVQDASRLTFAGHVSNFEAGVAVTVVRTIDPDEDLYVNDHRFGPHLSDEDPALLPLAVVPLTVSVEMMAEVAGLLMPSLRVVGAKNIQASKWIDIEAEGARVELEFTAQVAKDKRTVHVTVHPHKREPSAEDPLKTPLAEATILFDRTFPTAPPLKAFHLKASRACRHTADELYTKRRMFHGPSFQGISSVDGIGEDGVIAKLKVLPTDRLFRTNKSPSFIIDPFLLDAAGQIVGYWPIEYLEEGFIVFPIRIGEVTLYRENLEPGTECVCNVRIEHVSARQIRANMDIIGPDGELWMRIVGWEDWRFYWPKKFYDFWRYPNEGVVSEKLELPLPPDSPDMECRKMAPFGEMGSSIWENLWGHLVLSRREREQYHAMPAGERRTEWIFGRSVAKDAVRMWVKRHHNLTLYPADVEIETDKYGRPVVVGSWTEKIGGAPTVSISHKGSVAVAVAARAAVGIDLEHVQQRADGFAEVAFDETEREMLAAFDSTERTEWMTRFWSAKEAAGKAIGIGLIDGPATMIVRRVDRERDCLILTPGNGSAARGASSSTQELRVHSTCDGDLIVTVAIGERQTHAKS